MEIAGYVLWIGFRSLKMDFSFSMQISYDAQSVLSALLGNRSDGFGGLCSSQSCPIVHAHFLPLIPLLMLYCLVLINRNYNKDFFPVLLYVTLPPFFGHIFFFLMAC